MHETIENSVEILKHFALYGDMESFRSFGTGHINTTYLSVWNQGGTRVRYIHQRINRHVFAKPEEVVENIRCVTAHIAAKLAAAFLRSGVPPTGNPSPAAALSTAGQQNVTLPASSSAADAFPLAAAPPPAAFLSTSALHNAMLPAAPSADERKSLCPLGTSSIQSCTPVFPPSRQTLTLIPAKDGRFFYIDEAGEYWRTYLFIEGAAAFEIMEDTKRAYKAGAAVGTFQRLLADYSGVLHETIPNFHNMRCRYAQLDEAVRRDEAGRAASVQKELHFLEENRVRGMILTDGLIAGQLQWRVTHNDTKLNNMLFDIATGEVLCLIDLDTVMPGTALFDIGDLIRTGTNTACEDEQDCSKVHCDVPLFHALVAGYLSTAGGTLTGYEKSLIAESGRNLAQIMAVRFLTDYINGDKYYKTARREHNLDRARTQIALMQSMDAQWDRLQLRASYSCR